ncbi:hypothetical protein ZIOFF_014210 [Zingiber officinale]|uniref:Glutathione S-transferase n=1 Tax=Zingiber officinale TaxID=94328 RepID=A0A8J5HPT1_ZINOF|nr:hypothetical protein ZIOFF_014210 [Zingiber officinale]
MDGAAIKDVMVLGFRQSPFVIRVGITLLRKKAEHEFLEPVYKSTVIVEYIDEVWPGRGSDGSSSILPTDPIDHIVTWFWAAYIQR